MDKQPEPQTIPINSHAQALLSEGYAVYQAIMESTQAMIDAAQQERSKAQDRWNVTLRAVTVSHGVPDNYVLNNIAVGFERPEQKGADHANGIT